jgi:membrane protease YdiL (CAAX protease family)
MTSTNSSSEETLGGRDSDGISSSTRFNQQERAKQVRPHACGSLSLAAGDQSRSGMRTKKPLVPFVVYVVGFFGIWIAWVLFAYPRVAKIGDATLAYALINIAFKSLLWVAPVFAYLRYIDRVDPVDYLRLREHWKRGVLIGLAYSVLSFFATLAQHGPPHPTMHNVTWNSIFSTSILIGFFEEIPFRGFILQKIEERTGFWAANLISSLLFLAIHLPGWISLHILPAPRIIAVVFILGALFAVLLHYSKSLWSAIIAHSLNDFFSAVLF